MSKNTLTVNGKDFSYASLRSLKKDDVLKKMPFSLKILAENLLRFSYEKELLSLLNFFDPDFKSFEINFHPSRILMQDFTGVPAVVDLAAMRDACQKKGFEPKKINPLIPVDLVIDHSVMVDYSDSQDARGKNVELEYQRNIERYNFLKWGQSAFKNFRVVPPGNGICHQVNLEYLSPCVFVNDQSEVYPDSLVGTDSHTTMINGLSVLGWGVGGIEAEACMLGQPLSLLVPDVLGVKLKGRLNEGVTATDLVLTITNILRQKGVVGKFVEYFGSGLNDLPLSDRATIANMAPEYGATCGFFPIDDETLKYLKLTGRDQDQIDLVEAYAKEQFLWRDDTQDPIFKDVLEIDLSSIEPTLSGPKRPQDKILLKDLKAITSSFKKDETPFSVLNKDFTLSNNDVVLAAITSCTNTSNPSVMIAAGLLAKKAVQKGLVKKPWVKTSLAPGSQVVEDYLKKADLLPYLEKVGFHIVGFGCTTCIGNSGPLDADISQAIETNDLLVSGVLSGNRNFEGRIHPLIKANYLASPPLVVAFALTGTTHIDLTSDPLAVVDGENIFLKDIWPTNDEIQTELCKALAVEDFKNRYGAVFKGDSVWQSLKTSPSDVFNFDENSTYVKLPPYFDKENSKHQEIKDIKNARILGLFGDSITTDHISPAGNIKEISPAGMYLKNKDVLLKDFNSYGARRGNHEVMMRGTFANIRLQNEMTPEKTGGYTKHPITGETATIYDAAMGALSKEIPLVIFAGKEYGTGSSRDWAAKGTALLGVKAVIAESFERIHRSNLVGMGILPLVFLNSENRKTLALKGDEKISIDGIANDLLPQKIMKATITYSDGALREIELLCRIDTAEEVAYFKHGGILPYVLKGITT
ncbi:MAG: Aconitate hydratase A [Holosporales bacterium]